MNDLQKINVQDIINQLDEMKTMMISLSIKLMKNEDKSLAPELDAITNKTYPIQSRAKAILTSLKQ